MVVKRNVSPLPYFLRFKEYLRKGKYTIRISGKSTVEATIEVID